MEYSKPTFTNNTNSRLPINNINLDLQQKMIYSKKKQNPVTKDPVQVGNRLDYAIYFSSKLTCL